MVYVMARSNDDEWEDEEMEYDNPRNGGLVVYPTEPDDNEVALYLPDGTELVWSGSPFPFGFSR